MRVTDRFKAAQRSVFQDKTIIHRARSKATGSLGSVTASAGAKLGEYQVNLQIVQDAVVAAEWGLRLGKDAFMTCSDALAINVGDFVQYDGTVYQVQEALARDSHQRWVLSATDEEAISGEG
jgi:hypothetical protein